ncbi:hypothetical protein [Oenococcus oeni]|uniref:hypothetical protein n=1 Tax=Oenococcus oeni TaxID=1247 RepID=UPI000277B517|nr:hypothetical protein [Oenococcus oeni]EJO05769.1 hypothetical protein AWRIB422_970 [Oenococcus oeni AWRIB422]EJO07473.1 hypothetical protein AWRIB548_444 [Oenococcus oeni AWRIB548]KEP86893.1 hypothetical protein X278_00275 [Oenococcus oeni IOEB_0205]KGH68312.1 hypothetical protein X290_01425 [Oenococcus oeni IOEB_B16]OIL93605.1 hypothetical protein ATX43_03805 [Oenococcus oeni]
MKEKTVSQLAKLMADEKIIAILKATKNKKGLTSKEISKKPIYRQTNFIIQLKKCWTKVYWKFPKNKI